MKKRIISLVISIVLLLTSIVGTATFSVSAANFTPRTTAPSTSNAYYYSSNPFYQSGYGMPNCTCYAYGRAYELLGHAPNLSRGNAGAWWWYNKNKGIYSYGSTPKLGAIACWDRYDQNRGHVAVVEAINGNTITISESHYSGVNFDTRTINSNSSNYLTSMRFLGYIYIGEFEKNDIDWTKDNRYPTPITAYPQVLSDKLTVYNSDLVAYSLTDAHIAHEDECTINAVYKNGYCSVTYPTSSGSRTEYAKTSDFIAGNVTPYAWVPSQNTTTYKRSDMSASFGSAFTTDTCTVVCESGSKLQIIYPVPGGYKLGWVDATVIPPSDFPTPMKGYNASATVRTTVYESLNTMGTYWGQIFVDDECTLNSVNLNGGWVHVTYPVSSGTKSGYVYLSEFVPSGSKLTHFYKTTVTQQSDTFRKDDMATKYGWVSVGDEITVVGKSGNKLQILYPLDAQYGGGYKIAWMYDTYVVKNLTGISVSSNPSKVTYLEGESLNTNGLVITAKYDDGSTANVTSSCTLSGYSNTPGVKTVTATYNGKQTAFTVTVSSKSPAELTIFSLPTKTTYLVGEDIDLSGVSVKVIYNNGSYKTISNSDEMNVLYDDDITDTPGNKEITISYVYNNKTISTKFGITVKAAETPTPATYTIAYDANGGTNAPASQTKTEDENLVLTKDVPERDGYTFKGWSTSSSSQTVVYKAGATYTANANATLYAVWEKNIDTNAPAFVISDVSVKAGSTVTVDISIKNNPGITAFNFSVDYPEEVMALTGVEYKTLFSSKASGSKTMTSPFIISWFSTLSEDETANGVIATLTFKVNEDVEAGGYPINLTYDENNVFDSSFTNIAFEVDNGEVTVTDYVPGDVNGDTVVNMKDIVLLQQYLNDWDVTIDEAAANVNGDTSVNMKDIVLLQQYLNDWDVELK